MLNEFFKNVHFERRRLKIKENFPACKELNSFLFMHMLSKCSRSVVFYNPVLEQF